MDSFGWQLRHGDVEGAVAFFRRFAAMPDEELASRGRHARARIQADLSKAALCKRLCDLLEEPAS